jgi:polyhydroxybutyrate depolymerase
MVTLPVDGPANSNRIRRNPTPYFLLLVFLLGCEARAASVTLTWNVDGVQREALVYAPPAAGAKAPVIFGFHGHGGTMRTASVAMHFQDVWPEAVVVYPQGIPTATRVDLAGRHSGWSARDLKFFDAMLATLRTKYRIDDKRVYTAGFSNGAMFSLLLWAERANELAGVAVCAGVLVDAHPTVPRPLIHIAGELDRIADYALQVETMKREREIDGCSDDGKPLGFGATLYPSSKGAPVETVIHRGGHVYPPNASLWIVKFFTR